MPKMSRRRKKVYQNVKITGIADKGKAVGRDEEGRVFFVEGPVPGDVVDVLVLRKKKGFLTGVVDNYQSYSEKRKEAKCQHFGVCGGCKWQNLDYQEQLAQKETIVKDAVRKIGQISPDLVLPIMGCEETFYYRNKLEYSFSSKRWLTTEEVQSDEVIDQKPAFGFHRPGVFDKIVDIESCHLQAGLTDEIRNFVRKYALENGLSFYNIRENYGFLRNCIIRNSTLGEWMVTMVFGEKKEKEIPQMLQSLVDEFPQISSLNYVVNQKKNDTILDQEVINFSGKAFMLEALGEVAYKIGPKSFFQTNTKQAIRLYDVAVDFAELSGKENVYDLYTGLGSIALYLSRHCKQVVGVETVIEAIQDAKENAKHNGITNAQFVVGDVKDMLNPEFVQNYDRPDLIITDPPRAGMHKDVVQTLLEIACSKLVYISCNPATQARDLALLSEKYETIKIQPVDMFPHTSHIETVALLKLKG